MIIIIIIITIIIIIIIVVYYYYYYYYYYYFNKNYFYYELGNHGLFKPRCTSLHKHLLISPPPHKLFMCLNSKWHLKLTNQCLWNHLYNNCFQLATVREHFKDITNELENIPVSILLILYCGCFTSTSKYAAKNVWAQPPTKSVGLHWLVVGWGLILCQILLIMWTEKYSIL